MTDKEMELTGNSGELNKSSEDAPKSDYSDFEQQCIDAGWNPKGSKTADKWALDGLKVRNEKITDLYKITDNLKDMMSKQEQLAMNKARKELLEERDQAIARGDVQAVHQLEEQHEEMQTQKRKELIAFHANKFVDKHADWCKATTHEALNMQKALKEMDKQLFSQGLHPEKHFETLENYMKEEFPLYFNKDETSLKKAQAVEGSNSAVIRSSKKEITFDDLNDDQKFWANKYEKLGLYTKKQYIEELIKAGTLK